MRQVYQISEFLQILTCASCSASCGGNVVKFGGCLKNVVVCTKLRQKILAVVIMGQAFNFDDFGHGQ